MSHERGGDERMQDAGVEAAWRAASTEEPARQLDTAILAAARAEVRRRSPSASERRPVPWWMRWQPLVAAAGVAALAFLLVPRLPTEPERQERLSVPASPVPAATVPPEAQDPAAAPVAQPEARVPAAAAAPPEAKVPAAASASSKRMEQDAPDYQRQTLPQQGAEPFPGEIANRTDAPAADTAGASSSALARDQLSGMAATKSAVAEPMPDASVQRIVELHETGDLSAAAAELRALRRRFPDADSRLPPSLREWAASVGPDGDR